MAEANVCVVAASEVGAEVPTYFLKWGSSAVWKERCKNAKKHRLWRHTEMGGHRTCCFVNTHVLIRVG